MKKTYTRKQITEAIAYWKKQLKMMNEDLYGLKHKYTYTSPSYTFGEFAIDINMIYDAFEKNIKPFVTERCYNKITLNETTGKILIDVLSRSSDKKYPILYCSDVDDASRMFTFKYWKNDILNINAAKYILNNPEISRIPFTADYGSSVQEYDKKRFFNELGGFFNQAGSFGHSIAFDLSGLDALQIVELTKVKYRVNASYPTAHDGVLSERLECSTSSNRYNDIFSFKTDAIEEAKHFANEHFGHGASWKWDGDDEIFGREDDQYIEIEKINVDDLR